MRWCRIVERRKKSYVSLMLATDATDTRRCNKVSVTRAFCRLSRSPHYILLSRGTYELFAHQHTLVHSRNREWLDGFMIRTLFYLRLHAAMDRRKSARVNSPPEKRSKRRGRIEGRQNLGKDADRKACANEMSKEKKKKKRKRRKKLSRITG